MTQPVGYSPVRVVVLGIVTEAAETADIWLIATWNPHETVEQFRSDIEKLVAEINSYEAKLYALQLELTTTRSAL